MSNSDAKKDVDGLARKLFVINRKSITTENDFNAFVTRKGELMELMNDIPKIQLLRQYSEIQLNVTGLLMQYIQQNDDYQTTINSIGIYQKYVVGNREIADAFRRHEDPTDARRAEYEHYRSTMTTFLANMAVMIRSLWNELGEFGGENCQNSEVARLDEEKMSGIDKQLEELRGRIESLTNELRQAGRISMRADQNQDQEPDQEPESEPGKSSAPRQFHPYDEFSDSGEELVRPVMDESSEQKPELKKEDRDENSVPSTSSSGGSKKRTDGYESFDDDDENQGPVFDEYRTHESRGSSSRPDENRHHHQHQRPIFRGIAPRGHYDRNVNGECAFCGLRHFSNSCGDVPDVDDRAWILRQKGKCEYCLNDHGPQCRKQIPCDYCWKAGEERYHHKAICRKATNRFGGRF